MDRAVREWYRLMRMETSLRQRIHHQHRLIISKLETPAESAEMTEKLAQANALLAQLKVLLGEVGVGDALADPPR